MAQTIPLNLSASNQSVNSNDLIQARIIQDFNPPLINNLEDYNIHLLSMTVNASEMPILNIYKQINWTNTAFSANEGNFNLNRTNMTVSITALSGYPFEFPDPRGCLLTFPCGVEDPGNAGMWSGCGCYLQYLSENVDTSVYPNPTPIAGISGSGTASYPDFYFNIHSIQEVLDMINTAMYNCLNNALDIPEGDNVVPYFDFSPSTGLYTLYHNAETPSFIGTYELYCNDFLERIIDGFRFQSLAYSNLLSTSVIPVNGGLDNKFILNNKPQNIIGFPSNASTPGTPFYWFAESAEFSTTTSLSDKQSILIVANNPCLKVLNQTYIQTKQLTASPTQQGNMLEIACIKALDIDFQSNDIAQMNNCFIQYENLILDKPLCINPACVNLAFNQADIQVYSLDTDNVARPLVLGSMGHFNIKFLLKNKYTGEELSLPMETQRPSPAQASGRYRKY